MGWIGALCLTLKRKVADLHEGLKHYQNHERLHIAFSRDARCGSEINDIQILMAPGYVTLGRPKPDSRVPSTIRRNKGVLEVPPLGYQVIKTIADDENCAASVSGDPDTDFFIAFSQQF